MLSCIKKYVPWSVACLALHSGLYFTWTAQSLLLWLLVADHDTRLRQVIELKVSAAGGVTWEAADEAQLSSTGGEHKQPKKVMQVAVPQWCGKWAVGMDAFKDGVVGAKSKNIAGKPLPVSF